MQTSRWNDYDRIDFTFDARECILVVPDAPAPGRPWIWRTEFFDAWPAVDIALLGKGFHVAYINIFNMFGAPSALGIMDAFYDHLRRDYQLSAKPVMEGFSRGGLFAFNWAALHPDRVSCIYADAPVCDFKSWPGGKGVGIGSEEDWELCKSVYGLSEQEAMDYKFNPVDNLKPLADAGIAILSVCGDVDEVVPMVENTSIVEKRYRELGGKIEVIVKPGIGHHPHSLEDPTPIVDFILREI